MRTLQLDYKNIDQINEKLTLCLGYFDGIHLGHQKLILEAVKTGKYKVGVLTFDKPVSTFINNGKSTEVVTSLDDRAKALARLGVDYYLVLHIDEDFIKLSKDKFIELLKKLNAQELFFGLDYRFGYMAQGSPTDLEKEFLCHEVSLLSENNKKVAIQDIIKHIKDGDLEYVKTLLGRNYLISGVVEKGNGIGHTIGFPTMNLKMSTNYVLPKYGVYKTIAYVDNLPHLSLTNVGVKPTVGGNSPTIEVHIPGLNIDAYGSSLALEFIEFIRPEIKFSSLEELTSQIKLDMKKIN